MRKLNFILICLCCYTQLLAQNTFPSTGDVGIGTTTPGAALQIIKNSSYSSPLLKLEYGWDKPDLISVYRSNYKMVTLGNGGGTYSHGVMELFNDSENEAKIKFSASPFVDSYINTGNLGIGTTATNGYKLAVNGSLFATSVKVRISLWSDFVFKPSYQLMPLSEVAVYIKEHGHLPGVPAEKDIIGKDLDLAKTNALLLQKIEELTLYLIELENQIKEIKNRK